MKKRNIVYGLIALEIICIPVSAKVIDKVMHAFPDSIIATELPRQPGKTMIAISSNKPFVISSANYTGELDINITQTGMIYKTSYGEQAEMPGPSSACAAPSASETSIIYAAENRTAKTRGKILSQTVMVELRYDASAEPVFEVTPRKKKNVLPAAPSCETAQLAEANIPS